MKLSFEIPRKSNGRINTLLIKEDLFLEICSLTPFIIGGRETIRERIYCIENDLQEIPKCQVCGDNALFSISHQIYNKSCSKACEQKIRISSLENNNLEKYGVSHIFKLEEFKEKFKQTCILKFGVDNPWKSKIIKEKITKTNIEKYGVSCNFLDPNFYENNKLINLERYGYEYNSQRPEIALKISKAVSLAKKKHFQERRNAEGTDYSGVVYILYFTDLNFVKIGLTSDFENRAKGLRKDFGEFIIIELIETEECFKLESELHEKYSNYRICLEEGTGRTEFFNKEILKEINDTCRLFTLNVQNALCGNF